MASKFFALSIVVMLLMDSGCSKSRGWLSRKDFAEMQDPFMEPSEAIAGKDDSSRGSKGRATLGDSSASIADRRDQSTTPGSSGPKPIRTAGATGDTSAKNRVSSAVYPSEPNGDSISGDNRPVKSYSGPALSDFLQQKRADASNTSNPANQNAQAAAPRSTQNPAATRAALPTMSPEAENFSSFLSTNSNTVAEKSQQANQPVQTAGNNVDDFVSWAEQRKAELSTEAQSARSTVAGAPAQATAATQSVFQQAKTARQEMVNSMATPEFDGGENEKATPLLKQKFTPPDAAPLPRAKAPGANSLANDVNPFADSYGDFQSSESNSTSQKPATATSETAKSKPSLDESFRMDTGWKPSNMIRP